MLQKRSPFLLIAAITVLLVHACILVGGGKLAIALCTFALMIGGPMALLIWLGSLPDAEARRQQLRRHRAQHAADARLWQRTLSEMTASFELSPHDMQTAQHQPMPFGTTNRTASRKSRLGHRQYSVRQPQAGRAVRPILALSAMVASAIGVAGCANEIPAEAWTAVRPGMQTAELVSLIGGPDYVRSNGAAEVWQYCRDTYGRDEGRNARYYTAILVDKQQVKDVQTHPVYSDAGCQAFYRASF